MNDATRPLDDDASVRPRDPAVALAGVLLATVGPEHAVDVLLAEFGWDRAFQALATRTDDAGRRAFEVAWERLVLGPLMRGVARPRPSR